MYDVHVLGKSPALLRPLNPASARSALTKPGRPTPAQKEEFVYDNDQTAAAARPARSWRSRAAAALPAAAVLMLAGPAAALGATAGHRSPPAVSAAVPGLGSATAAGSQMMLTQASRHLRAAVRAALARGGTAAGAVAHAKARPSAPGAPDPLTA